MEINESIFENLPERDILSLKCERAFLVGINEQQEELADSNYHLEELHNLVDTMGIEPVSSIMVKLREKNSRYLIGKGKMEEIGEMAEECRADLIIFDCQLSPSQQRNLEQYYNIAVIDRQEVIIDIFADRASTKEAVLQVALARMKYSLPRLTRAWTHLSKQKGGVRGTRGKGETQLESDRRLVMNRITTLKKELEKVKKNRDVQRKKRLERPVPSISIVGYTNAGKSSLLNLLSDADVLTEDKLFATLDPTTRKIKLEGGREIILTDTVGFIRKLPHDLVDAFKSTLEEAVHADIILHVVDVSNHEYEDHIKVTEEVLADLGA
ncbi:MAG: GTPase HflX, partial [Calditrichaeota bacterium]